MNKKEKNFLFVSYYLYFFFLFAKDIKNQKKKGTNVKIKKEKRTKRSNLIQRRKW